MHEAVVRFREAQLSSICQRAARSCRYHCPSSKFSSFVNTCWSDIIVPRGVENKVAIGMVTDHIQKTLGIKSKNHQAELKRLGQSSEDMPLPGNVVTLPRRPQVVGVSTIILDPETDRENFCFYFDRMAVMLVEKLVHGVATWIEVNELTRLLLTERLSPMRIIRTL